MPLACAFAMPMFPEGWTSLATDDEARSLKKWNGVLYDTWGNVGTVPYPEGTQPLASDDAHRSKIKIDAIYAAIG